MRGTFACDACGAAAKHWNTRALSAQPAEPEQPVVRYSMHAVRYSLHADVPGIETSMRPDPDGKWVLYAAPPAAEPKKQTTDDEVLADALQVLAQKIAHAEDFEPHLLHIMMPVDVLRVLQDSTCGSVGGAAGLREKTP